MKQQNCHARSKQRTRTLRAKRHRANQMKAQLKQKAEQGNEKAQLTLLMLSHLLNRFRSFENFRRKAGGRVSSPLNQRQKRKRARQANRKL